jgi:hypothetical protein
MELDHLENLRVDGRIILKCVLKIESEGLADLLHRSMLKFLHCLRFM